MKGVGMGKAWKKCRYAVEAFLFHGVLMFFRLLPLDAASALAGFLGRFLGPLLGVNRIATRNLKQAFPNWPEAQITTTIRGMWDNFTRIPAEYAHGKDLTQPAFQARIEVCGKEVLMALAAQPKPILFTGAHFGNWQIATLSMRQFGIPVTQFYRPSNNPWVQKIMQDYQRPFVDGLIPKSTYSFRHLLGALKDGLNVLVFFDQHMHKGVPVPFFGRPALTAPVTVRLAKKMGCPLVLFHVERLGGSHFRVTFEEPVLLDQDEETLLTFLNSRLEAWIMERPEQWFWLHNRWKSC